MNRRPTVVLILGCAILSAACYAVIAALEQDGYPPDWRIVAAQVLIVCNLATIPPALFAPRGGAGQAGATAALLAVVWRLLTFLAALALWTATKWPAGEFAAKCLVGCYFPFLALESWLSIRHTPR